VINWSVGIAASFYIIVGMFGYFMFYDKTLVRVFGPPRL
jgi:hypothetical protein